MAFSLQSDEKIELDNGQYKPVEKKSKGFSYVSDEEEKIKESFKNVGVKTDKTSYRVNIPELDPSLQGDLSFNWKAAYEAETGNKLENTVEDNKKLGQYILSKVGSDDKLQELAYKMHLYNPNIESWSEFIQSDNGKQFSKAISDMGTVKTAQDVENVWEDGTFANTLTKLMLPVSRTYAKENYKNIDDDKMKRALAFDIGSNAIMTGLGGRIAGLLGKPIVGYAIDNAAAPVLTELGNMAVNDENVSDAAKNALLGIATNFATPRKMASGSNRIFSLVNPPKTAKGIAQQAANKAANETRAIVKEIRSGKAWPSKLPEQIAEYNPETGYDIVNTNEVRNTAEAVYPGNIVLMKTVPNSKKDWLKNQLGMEGNMTNITIEDPIQVTESITREQLERMRPETVLDAKNVVRSKKQGTVDTNGKTYKIRNTEQYREKLNEAKKHYIESLHKHGDLRDLTDGELMLLGKSIKESKLNYVNNKYIDPVANGVLGTYMTNMWGRPEFGQHLLNGVIPLRSILTDDSDTTSQNLAPNIQYLLQLNNKN